MCRTTASWTIARRRGSRHDPGRTGPPNEHEPDSQGNEEEAHAGRGPGEETDDAANDDVKRPFSQRDECPWSDRGKIQMVFVMLAVLSHQAPA